MTRYKRGNTCTGELSASSRSFRREESVEKAILALETLIQVAIIRAFEIRGCDGLRRALAVGNRITKRHCCRGRGIDFITDGAQLRAQRETPDMCRN